MACGCGLIGSLVISPGSVSPVYSNAGSRGGESALFSLDVQEIDANVGLEVMVQTKNRGDTSWLDLTGFASPLTSTGVHALNITSFKEQYRVRVRYESGTASGDMARIANMNFAWRPY